MKQKAKVGNMVLGKCKDCGKPILRREDYLVRPEIWAEAGMGSDYYGTGFLHQTCLEKRLGRALVPDDLMVWVKGIKGDGVEMAATQEGLALLKSVLKLK